VRHYLTVTAWSFGKKHETMNWMLIVSMVLGFGILAVGGFYLIVYYQHPDDHNESYVPKFVVLMGFVLAGATVLLLPLDVANNEGYAGELWKTCLSLELTGLLQDVRVTTQSSVEVLTWSSFGMLSSF